MAALTPLEGTRRREVHRFLRISYCSFGSQERQRSKARSTSFVAVTSQESCSSRRIPLRSAGIQRKSLVKIPMRDLECGVQTSANVGVSDLLRRVPTRRGA